MLERTTTVHNSQVTIVVTRVDDRRTSITIKANEPDVHGFHTIEVHDDKDSVEKTVTLEVETWANPAISTFEAQ